MPDCAGCAERHARRRRLSSPRPRAVRRFTILVHHPLIHSLSTAPSTGLPTPYAQPCPQDIPELIHSLRVQASMNHARTLSDAERESFSFALGVRAIGKALGLTRWGAWQACRNRLLPTVRVGRAFAVPLSAVTPYRLALARELLARGAPAQQPVAAPHQRPEGGGLVPASGADGPTPARCKKMRPKAFEEAVVTLL